MACGSGEARPYDAPNATTPKHQTQGTPTSKSSPGPTVQTPKDKLESSSCPTAAITNDEVQGKPESSSAGAIPAEEAEEATPPAGAVSAFPPGSIVAHENGCMELLGLQQPQEERQPQQQQQEKAQPNSSTNPVEWARWTRRIRANAKSGMFPSQQEAYNKGGAKKMDAFTTFVVTGGNQAAVEARMKQAGVRVDQLTSAVQRSTCGEKLSLAEYLFI